MLILSSTEVLLDCFHFLAVVNLAAVNTWAGFCVDIGCQFLGVF